ncbi:MAG: hypothetical protein FWC77_06130 [Defluviitaleaceae bacterium]|nr:hypothetical protein [Defluviitaleaceae bacterium]
MRHIARAPLRTGLLAGVALFNMLALAFLLHTIETSEAKIDYMYLNTYVTGAIVRGDTLAVNTNANIPLVHEWTVNRLNDTGFIAGVYLEKIVEHFVLIPSPMMPREGFDGPTRNILSRYWAHNILVINDFPAFVYDNRQRLLEPTIQGYPPFAGELIIEFSESFGPDDFNYNEDELIPVLVHFSYRALYEQTEEMITHEGNYAYILELYRPDAQSVIILSTTPVRIIGYFMGGHPASLGRFQIAPPRFLMPYNVSQEHAGYATVRFVIDPANNRRLDYFGARVDEILANRMSRANGDVPLSLFLDDSELRFVVMPMEQNLSLLRQLLPIVMVLTCIVSGVLSFLLMMLNAKLAAVMRMLGITRKLTQALLIMMQMAVCILGVAAGVIIIPALGIDTSATLVLPVILFFVGGAAGSFTGATAICSRRPLALIQVNE